MTTNVYMFGCLVVLSVFFSLNSVEAQQWKIRNNSLERVQARDSSESKSHLFKYDSQNWYAFPSEIPSGSMFLWSDLGLGSIAYSHIVLLVDKFGKRLRRGTTISAYGYTPLTFVQMKSTSKFLPQSYRDKWIYAVVMFPSKLLPPKDGFMKIVPDGQMVFNEEASAVITPIRWDEDAEKFKIGLGLLRDSLDLKIRDISQK